MIFKNYDELVNRARKGDEKALDELFKNYYQYVDVIVDSTYDFQIKELVRIALERELKIRIRRYFSNNCTTHMSVYLNGIKRDFKTRFSSYSNTLIYLMNEFPDEKEVLYDMLVKNLMPIINNFLKENNLYEDVFAKVSCLSILNDEIQKSLSKSNIRRRGKDVIKLNLIERLQNLKLRNLTGVESDYLPLKDEDVDIDIVRQKYSYIIKEVMKDNRSYFSDEDIKLRLKCKYDYLTKRYLDQKLESSISAYLFSSLKTHLRFLDKLSKRLESGYILESQKLFESWSSDFNEEECAIAKNFYINEIRRYIKSGYYKTMNINDYLLEKMIKFDLNHERKMILYVDNMINNITKKIN